MTVLKDHGDVKKDMELLHLGDEGSDYVVRVVGDDDDDTLLHVEEGCVAYDDDPARECEIDGLSDLR